jgi:DNA repair protein RecO
MRHKYATEGIVLARSPLREAGLLITVLTPDLGLVRARAEGVRRSGAKLAHALQTLSMNELMLVRGKEGWRITGAMLVENSYAELREAARPRLARVAQLTLRLVHDESSDALLHPHLREFIEALKRGEDGEEAETLVVLRLLSTLGFDSGELPPEGYDRSAISYVRDNRTQLIARINRGITAAGP